MTRLERVVAARRRLHGDGPPSERRPGDAAIVSLPSRDVDALRDLVVAEDASRVLEVGLAYGASALGIQEGLAQRDDQDDAGSAHVIVDAHQDLFDDAGWQLLDAAGVTDRCTLHRGRSQHVLPDLVEAGERFDLAFVDGSHVFHAVFVDLVHIRELVRPGGLVVLDDCRWPSVSTAVAYFVTNLTWREHPIDADTRLTAFRLPDPPVERAFDDFVGFTG